MSYRCTISFKIIEPTELYSFLLQYKQECLIVCTHRKSVE